MQISFTWAQLVSACAGLTAIFGVIQLGIKAYKAAKAPDQKQDERLSNIENRLAQYDAFFEKDKTRLDSLEANMKLNQTALTAIMHDRLYQNCRHYLGEGCVDVDGLKNLECLYASYHELGGNGTGTELYNRVKGLPIEKE